MLNYQLNVLLQVENGCRNEENVFDVLACEEISFSRLWHFFFQNASWSTLYKWNFVSLKLKKILFSQTTQALTWILTRLLTASYQTRISSNKESFNVKKIIYILISNRNKNQSIIISLNGYSIEFKPYQKFLEVFNEDKLKFDNYINNL